MMCILNDVYIESLGNNFIILWGITPHEVQNMISCPELR